VRAPAPRAAAARGWFELRAPELTDSVKRELAILRNRTFLDAKRHYKTAREDRAVPTVFAIGTLVDGAGGAGGGSRAPTRAVRAPTLVDTLLGDDKFTAYAGRAMDAVRARTTGGGKEAFKAKKAAAAATWKKRRADYDAEHGKKKSKRKLY